MPSPVARVLAPYHALHRGIYLIAATRMVNTMGFSIVMPFVAVYLVEERGVLAKTAGLIYLLAGLAAATSQGLSGEAADRFGRRRVMVLALVLRALNMIVLGLAVRAHVSVHVLGALIVLNGVLRAMFDPAAGAAVTDLTPEDQRVAAFGVQRIGINVGWALGPALGGALAHHDFGTLFFFSSPVLLCAAFVASRVPEPGRPRRPTHDGREAAGLATVLHPRALAAAARANPPFFICLGLVFCSSMLTTQLFNTLTMYMGAELGFTKGQIGLVYTVNGVLVVLFQVPAVALIRRGGARMALVLGPLVYAVAYLAIGMSGEFAWIASCVAFLTFGEVMFSPALSDMAIYLGDPRRHGRSFGLFGLTQTLGVSLGPLLGGAVFDSLRDRHLTMWATFSVLMAIVTAAYAAFARRYDVRVQ